MTFCGKIVQRATADRPKYRSPPYIRLSPIQENYIKPVGTDVPGGPRSLRLQNVHPSVIHNKATNVKDIYYFCFRTAGNLLRNKLHGRTVPTHKIEIVVLSLYGTKRFYQVRRGASRSARDIGTAFLLKTVILSELTDGFRRGCELTFCFASVRFGSNILESEVFALLVPRRSKIFRLADRERAPVGLRLKCELTFCFAKSEFSHTL